MMQTQRVNDNHVLHPGASGLGTLCLELLQLLIDTHRQHALTANNKPLTDKLRTESQLLMYEGRSKSFATQYNA